MSHPALTETHEQLLADDRLLHLQLQAQEHIVKDKGRSTHPAATDQIPNSELIAALVRSAAFSVQQQLPTLVGTAAKRTQQEGDAQHSAVSIAVLSVVQQRWQALVLERLHAAQMFLPDVPLAAAPRTAQELASLRDQVADLTEAWERIGGSSSPFTGSFQAPSVSKLLYDAEDVLQAVTAVVSVPPPPPATACEGAASASGSGLEKAGSLAQQPVKMSLLQAVRAPSRVWLQSFFADLKADKRQVGVDDVLHSWFREQQVQQAYRAAASCSVAACRAAARSGLPASERPWVWAAALGLHAAPPSREQPFSAAADTAGKPAKTAAGSSSRIAAQAPGAAHVAAAGAAAADSRSAWWRLPSQRDQQLLQLLCEGVEQQVLLTDVLTCADVQRMADNEHYFVFEEAMRAILLAFSRDASTSSNAAVPAAPRLAAETPGGQQRLRPYPASGVLPFQGLASYLAPLCYMYEQPAVVYRVFVAMYCRYWCCLHTLNIRPAPSAGLPVLCRTFLELLQEVDPEVFRHLSRLAASPLDLAFPWIMSGFVTHLSPAETLLLWDRIIGFDSLLPLPVLAVAVMTFRRDLVLAAQSSDELLEVLEDLSQLRVVPLLQALLFDT